MRRFKKIFGREMTSDQRNRFFPAKSRSTPTLYEGVTLSGQG